MAHIPPSESINDSPTVCVQVNKQWVSYVMGRLEPLVKEGFWSGDDNTVYAATQEAEKLMRGLALGSVACMVPIGAVLPFFAGAVPTNYLPCDGSAVNKADYPDLYELLQGYVAETETTFNLPDLRLRVLMGSGLEEGGGFSLDVLATDGDLRHTLTEAQLPAHVHTVSAHNHTTQAHTHTQQAHNHTQNSHNHTQDSHNHTQNSHNHTQDSHNHAQNSHSHVISDPGHTHSLPVRQNLSSFGAELIATGANATQNSSRSTDSETTGISVIAATATNQAATATNQAATATNQAATATNQAATATNQAATAVNDAATVTIDSGGGGNTSSVGGGEAFYKLPPVLGVNYIIRAK